MYAIGVCNIATKLFHFYNRPCRIGTPHSVIFKGGTQGGETCIASWHVRLSTMLFAVIHPLNRDADQPDAEQLAYDLEHDYKGTGVETIVVCPKQPIEKIVALMDPSE